MSYHLTVAGVKQRTPGQMRHTFATLMLAAGENPTWVSRMLGHSSLKVTLERYNKFRPDLTHQDGPAFTQVLEDANVDMAPKKENTLAPKKGNIKVKSLLSGGFYSLPIRT
jgi:integrase